jgi:hypothetical protein
MKKILLSFLTISTAMIASSQCDPMDHDFAGAALECLRIPMLVRIFNRHT